MAHMDLLVGKVLGEYQIERLIGQSQLGAAYLALQPSQNRRAMVTIFPVPEGMLAQEYERFQLRVAREGEVLTRLAHPHILPVYSCGTQPGYAYLITAFAKETSLSQLLKQNLRFSPQQVLPLLQQIAAALDYAHGQGIVHEMLGLSNIIVSDDLQVRVAGFGLRSMLAIYGSVQRGRPLEHLSGPQGAFLGNPESIAPERVLGQDIDARADVYALGVILFTLLSGTSPFQGSQPLDTALQRLQQPAPSLRATCLDVPEAFDLVIGQMLERDPAKRTQYAGDAAIAFERTLQTFQVTQMQGTGKVGAAGSWMQGNPMTIPPTVNWFDEAVIPSDPWQGKSPAEADVFSPDRALSGTGKTLALSNTSSGPALLPAASPSQAHNDSASLGGTDPFLWWSAASTGFQAPATTPGTFASRPPLRMNSSQKRRRPAQQDRRRLTKLIVTGGVAAGVVSIGGISLARMAQSQKPSLSQLANTSQTGSTTSASTTTMAGNNTPTTSSTPGTQGTPAASSSPTAQPTTSKGGQPSPTAQPKPTQPPPTPTPGHTGTVIGHTNQANNSAVAFTNPADGQASWLVRMSNGNFVACEQACTHAGVPVKYNASTGQLYCPAHGALFNADGTNPTSPAPSPLPKVTIRVNGDGTITTG